MKVHTFLLRHVYTSTMTAYKFSKFQAAFVTFFLSACVVSCPLTEVFFQDKGNMIDFACLRLQHELVMAVVTKKIRMYLFVMQVSRESPHSTRNSRHKFSCVWHSSPQMAQLPLIIIGRIKLFRDYPALGNVSRLRYGDCLAAG